MHKQRGYRSLFIFYGGILDQFSGLRFTLPYFFALLIALILLTSASIIPGTNSCVTSRGWNVDGFYIMVVPP